MLKVSVSSLLRYLKNQLKVDERLNRIYVTGEISNFHAHGSGHLYFSLKDEYAAINCVMFRSDAASLQFDPKNGDKVIAYGSVSIFENNGALQLYVTRMQPDGLGELYIRYEALKKKLEAEGLFSQDRKISQDNRYPLRAAVLVGERSAAMSDIVTAFARRWPVCHVDYYPVTVQGENAPVEICSALRKVDPMGYDVVILARGGGSFEDLFCFNDEQIVRTICAMETFIVTGIGHEQDFTLADFAADLRAPTPTAAVELVTPSIEEVIEGIDEAVLFMRRKIQQQLQSKGMLYDYQLEKLMRFSSRIMSLSDKIDSDMEKIRQKMAFDISLNRQKISHQVAIMSSKTIFRLDMERNALKRLDTLMNAYSCQNVLKRGYTIIIQDGHIVRKRSALADKAFEVRFADGSIEAIERK